MHTFIGVQPVFHFKAAVFRIPTSAGDVFMRVDRTNYLNEERAVVEVDRERFFALWQSEPYSIHAEQAHGNEESWRSDRKFAEAAKGFSLGADNPVPLAEVNCHLSKKEQTRFARKWFFFREAVGKDVLETPYVAFTNGVTRTIWLAAHGARQFPVECSVREADRLQRLAGTSGTRWRTVDDLLPATA